MPDIRITIGGRLDRSVQDSFAEFKKLGKDAADAVNRDLFGRGGRGRSVNPELEAARAAHAEQSKLNRMILREQLRSAREADAQERTLARERTKERLAALREEAREKRKNEQAASALARQRSVALYRQYRDNERELDRFATRTSHRATRFLFPPPEGALGYAKRTANEIVRGLGVDFSLAGGISRSTERETAAMGLSQQERIATGKTRGTAEWKKISTDVGGELAVKPEEVTALIRSFTGLTGEFDAAASKAKELASITLAAGANMSETGSAAGYIYNQLKGMPGAAEMTLTVLRGIVGQTAMGAVEMADYAKQMGRVAANAKMFNGDVSKNILELSALTQLAVAEGGGTGGADAARAIVAFANTTSKGQRINAFKANGIDLFEKGGTIKKPIKQIIEESFVKSKGNIPALTKMWADTLGQKPLRALINSFNAKGGGSNSETERKSAFKAAWEEKVSPFMNAQLSPEQERANLAEREKTAAVRAEKFQQKLDQITDALAQKVLPAFDRLAPTVLKIAEAFGNFISWATENPGKLIAMAITASIARAGIESAFRSLLDVGTRRMLGGTGPAGFGPIAGGTVGGFLEYVVPKTGGSTVGGMLSAAGIGVALGAGVYSTIDYAGKTGFDESVKGTNEVFASLRGKHGEELSFALLEAKEKLRKVKEDRSIFGEILDFFGAGGVSGGAEIAGAEDFIARKQKEYEQFAGAGGKMTPEMLKDIAAEKIMKQHQQEHELDPKEIGKATGDALKGQTLSVRVVNAGDIGKGSAEGGPTVDDSGRRGPGAKK